MKLHKIRSKQTGLVSIVVTMVMILVISLIVVSFTQIIRREQRQTLDRQLNSQAFYAAETGVNQAVKAIREEGFVGDKSTCDPAPVGSPGEATINSQNVGPDNSVQVTCLLIDSSPPSLNYSNIDNESKTIPLVSETGANFETLTFVWQNKVTNTAADFAGGCNYPALPASGSWLCSVGVLRLDLIPLSMPGGLTRDNLNNNMFSVFLYPSTSGVQTYNYSSATGLANQGAVVQTQCVGSPAICTMTINTNSFGSNTYYARVRTVYGASALTINGTTTGGAATDLKNAQSVIDSTGRANDILRRVQVSVCTNRLCSVNLPDFVIQADNICKRYAITPDTDSITTDVTPASLCDPN